MPRYDKRSFGIEIEFAGSRRDVLRAISRAGIPVDEGYGDHSHWEVKEDGSVYNGGEVASRVLDWSKKKDRMEAAEVVRLMRGAGAVPSEQAGIHVHVGVHGLTDEQKASVAYGFMRHEDFLYRMASSGWDHMRQNAASFAHPYSRQDKADLIASDFSWRQVREVSHRDRYYGVNFQPATHSDGTIEFRLFNTTMNAERVRAFLATSVGLVRAAQLGALRRVKLDRYTCYPLGSMEQGYRSERAVFNAAMRMLAAGNTVLSQYDRRIISKYWRTAYPQHENIFGSGYHLPGWTGDSAVKKKKGSLSSTPQQAGSTPPPVVAEAPSLGTPLSLFADRQTDDQTLSYSEPSDDPDEPDWHDDCPCDECGYFDCQCEW